MSYILIFIMHACAKEGGEGLPISVVLLLESIKDCSCRLSWRSYL